MATEETFLGLASLLLHIHINTTNILEAKCANPFESKKTKVIKIQTFHIYIIEVQMQHHLRILVQTYF